jgi:hypothetical protein
VRALGQLEAYARDLAPGLSRSDRLRVLRAYLARDPSLRGESGRLARQASAWATRRIAEWSQRDRGAQRHFPLGPRAGSEPGRAPAPRV